MTSNQILGLIREKVRGFLGVVDPQVIDLGPFKKEILDKVEELVGRYSETKCLTCGKTILAYHGGFYRNMHGETFCCLEHIKRDD